MGGPVREGRSGTTEDPDGQEVGPGAPWVNDRLKEGDVGSRGGSTFFRNTKPTSFPTPPPPVSFHTNDRGLSVVFGHDLWKGS